MSESFVRTEFTPEAPAPAGEHGIIGWMRHNLFSSVGNTVLTLVGMYLIYAITAPLVQFGLIDAVWNGKDRFDCLGEPGAHLGACWAMVKAKIGQYIYFQYPRPERWRVDLVFYSGLAFLVPMLIPTVPLKKWNAILLLFVYPIASFVLLYGGEYAIPFTGQTVIDLPIVETAVWGGLLVTLVIAVTGIAASLPLGILFALGRRSKMPLVRSVSIVFIEFWRGIPLITVLFMSSVMLPLFLPDGVTFNKLVRALIGVALFSSAYMAETIRGGLQAIPKGQYEGAHALGLNYWKTMNLIVLPQAIKHVIPGIVNSFIALFKDTTLVLIIGMFDLLGAIQTSFTDVKWATPVQSHTGYLFAAAIFWVFCFSMSRYSIFMENRLHTGHKR